MVEHIGEVYRLRFATSEMIRFSATTTFEYFQSGRNSKHIPIVFDDFQWLVENMPMMKKKTDYLSDVYIFDVNDETLWALTKLKFAR